MPIKTIFQDEINASNASKYNQAKAAVLTKYTGGAGSRYAKLISSPKPKVGSTATSPTGQSYVKGSASPQPKPIAQPATPDSTAPVAPTYNLDALKQMLAGLEAQYGLDRTQLLSGRGEAADLYRFVLANLAAAQRQAESAVQEGGIRRGILRSGITQEQNAQVANQYGQQRADAASQRDQRLAEISLMLQQLSAELENEKVATATDYAETNLGTDEALAQALALV